MALKFNTYTDNFIIVDFPTEKVIFSFEDDSALTSILTFFVGRNYSAFEVDGYKIDELIQHKNYSDKIQYAYVDVNGYKVKCKTLVIYKLTTFNSHFRRVEK